MKGTPDLPLTKVRYEEVKDLIPLSCLSTDQRAQFYLHERPADFQIWTAVEEKSVFYGRGYDKLSWAQRAYNRRHKEAWGFPLLIRFFPKMHIGVYCWFTADEYQMGNAEFACTKKRRFALLNGDETTTDRCPPIVERLHLFAPFSAYERCWQQQESARRLASKGRFLREAKALTYCCKGRLVPWNE